MVGVDGKDWGGGSPEHKATATMEPFKTEHIHVSDRPSQSPDLNPSNLTELELFCKEEISVSRCAKLVETNPKDLTLTKC